MHATTRILPLAFLLLSLGGCEDIPDAAYFSRGAPESLLDRSTERVSINLGEAGAQDELIYWLNQDQPTRAELNCTDGDFACAAARHTLEKFGVKDVKRAPSQGGDAVHLIYERIVARDCDNRYLDNPHNPYNLNHPTFGCSMIVNTVQMVPDKRQFISPALHDNMDGRRAYQVQQGATQPNKYAAPNVSSQFQQLTTGGGGSGAGSSN